MDYSGLKKDELIKLLQEQAHLASAVEAKDQEIAKLLVQLDNAKQSNNGVKDQLILDINKKHEADHKLLSDSLAAWEKKYHDLDALRIQQLSTVLLAHGDLLKTLQGVVDTHLKLNQYIVDELSGGKE